MQTTKVRRWTKGPHDRLYVSTRPQGSACSIDIGWFDLRTHRQHLFIPGMMAEFDAAITWWLHLPKGQQPTPADVDDGDLAATPAGTSPQQRAEQLRPGPVTRFLARLAGQPTPDRSWRVGADGEQAVGRKLEVLTRRGWYILHSIPTGAGDIDHLLIGPAGVFVIDTKHHPRGRISVTDNAITVNGYRKPYAAEASHEARLARAAIGDAWGRPIHVTPLIVIHGHTTLTGWQRHHPAGVRVLPSSAVTAWLRTPGPAIHNRDDIEQLYTAARTPSTWRNGTTRLASPRKHTATRPAAGTDRHSTTSFTALEPPAYDPRTPQWLARVAGGDPWEQFTDQQAAEKLGIVLAEFLHLVDISRPLWEHPGWGRPPLPYPSVCGPGQTNRLWYRWALAEHFGASPAPLGTLELMVDNQLAHHGVNPDIEAM